MNRYGCGFMFKFNPTYHKNYHVCTVALNGQTKYWLYLWPLEYFACFTSHDRVAVSNFTASYTKSYTLVH